MNTQPTNTQMIGNVTTSAMVAGAQSVVLSGMTPVVFSRKCPGVAMSSGALPEKPNCQIAPAPARQARRNRKSMGMPFFSASLAKWIPMIGDNAIERK